MSISWELRPGTVSTKIASQGSVLVAPACTHIDLAIVRSLGRRGVPVVAAVPGQGGIAHRSRYCHSFFHLPAAPAEAVDAIARFVRRNPVSAVFCTDESFITLLNRERSGLEQNTRLLFAPQETFDQCLHKDKTLELARKVGLPTPRTEVITRLEDVGACAGLRFPVVLKPRHRDARMPHILPFKAIHVADFPELRRRMEGFAEVGEFPLVQEYFEGSGVGVELLIEAGEPRIVFQHRRIREYPSSGGIGVYCESMRPSPELVRDSVALLAAMNWEGVAMVEFRVDEASGRHTLMELNGRFWGSLPLALEAGADFPYWYFRSATGKDMEGCPRTGRPGVRCRLVSHDTARLLKLRHAGRAGWGDLWRYLAAYRPGVRYFVWSQDDPLPAVAGLVHRAGQFRQWWGAGSAAAARDREGSMDVFGWEETILPFPN